MGGRSTTDNRTAKRVVFDRAFDATVMAIDDTWSLTGRLEDISESGAKLRVFGKVNPRMKTDEFFLVMTSNGKVTRRSKLIWENGTRIGVPFVTPD
jgi:hypothetical protein